MSHVSEWVIHVHIYDDGRATSARAVLETGARTLSREGTAPDGASPEIAAELAASSALLALAKELDALAGADKAALHGKR